jgi:Zn finger protein HypA/HybF involved in hydrogenase expression
MLEIIAASTIAVALTVVMKGHKSDSSKLTEARATMQTIGVQIICGDCSGDEDRPLKTYLSRDGLCGQCGGRSFILASARLSPAQQVMMARLMEHKSFTDDRRLEPIEAFSRLGDTQIHSVTALDRCRLVS